MRVVCIVFVAIAVAAAFDNDSVEEFMTGEDMPEEEESLMQVVAKLRGVVPGHMAFHVDRLKHHAELMQSADPDKKKAFTHDFSKSKEAIQGVLDSMATELKRGHDADVSALDTSNTSNTKAINDAKTNGQSETLGFRNKACPTKRKELKADQEKKTAKSTMQTEAGGKICKDLGTTWGDMDIDKSKPDYGSELRNGWNKAHERYGAAQTAWQNARKAHETAETAHNTAMAAFKASLKVEVENADTACKSAHSQYETLKSEVQSNVNSRKQVYIATLVVKCYVDHMSNKDQAKECAETARATDKITDWNITPKKLADCTPMVDLTVSWGPENWAPTPSTCSTDDWNKKDDIEFYATLYDN